MSQFTPGPWRIGESHGGGSVDIKEANNHKLIATAITVGDHAQAQANARLIAAAPEMAAALAMANLPFTQHSAGYALVDLDDITKLRNTARALLARIDGETP